MHLWIDEDKCTGCGACLNACPKKAIIMKEDEKGFVHPFIGEGCIDCGKCREVCERECSSQILSERKELGVYAGWSRDVELRFTSTSGGLFTELASAVTESGGIAVGAAYDDELLVEHIAVENTGDLEKIRQSKYIQSRTGEIFREIKKYLREQREVIFCGTPCQAAALKSFLYPEEQEGLFVLDFICMGVNSPMAYKKWIQGLEDTTNKKVKKIWFKYKCDGWKRSPFVTGIIFEDHNERVLKNDDNLFMDAFLNKRCMLRPSCRTCRFKGEYRASDITLGDFWGIDEGIDDDRGISAVIVNSDKGKELLDRVINRIELKERTIEEVKKGNCHYDDPVKTFGYEKEFFDLLENLDFDTAVERLSAGDKCECI